MEPEVTKTIEKVDEATANIVETIVKKTPVSIKDIDEEIASLQTAKQANVDQIAYIEGQITEKETLKQSLIVAGVVETN